MKYEMKYDMKYADKKNKQNLSKTKILHFKKCKEIANNCNFIKFLKSKFAQAALFLTFEQSFRFFTT